MIENYVKSKYASLFIDAAEELLLKYEIIDKEFSIIRIYNAEKEFYMKGNITSFNHAVGRGISVSKGLTLRILEKQQLPVPKSITFQDRQEAKMYAEECGFPLVIKPTNRSNSVGVTINPIGEAQIGVALDEALKYDSFVMVEEFIEGLDYRITLFDGEIIAVTYRTPGSVIGDGDRNLRALIEKKNEQRLKDGLSLIKMRERDLVFLLNKNIDLEHVPVKGEFVRLQLGCEGGIGGGRHRIELTDIPEENNAMFRKIANTVLLRFVGIDFITPDITQSYKSLRCGVNEVNSAPMQDIHYYDTLPGDNYSCRRILKSFFELE